MANQEDVVERLDRLIAIVSLAFQSEIAAARAGARSDPTIARILDGTEDWVSAGDLKRSVSKATGVGEKTVERRLVELVQTSGLTVRGNGPSRQYKRTGVL